MNYHWDCSGAACPVVEFHDMRTKAGALEAYLDLSDSAFAGADATLIGRFHVAGHANRVLTLRGFASMPARRRALAHLDAAAGRRDARRQPSESVRSSQVLLTRAVRPQGGIARLQVGQGGVAVISELRFPELIGPYHLWLRLWLRKAGCDPLASYATLEAVNDVPSVPVVQNRSHHIALLAAGGDWPGLPPELAGMVRHRPEILALEPARCLVW